MGGRGSNGIGRMTGTDLRQMNRRHERGDYRIGDMFTLDIGASQFDAQVLDVNSNGVIRVIGWRNVANGRLSYRVEDLDINGKGPTGNGGWNDLGAIADDSKTLQASPATAPVTVWVTSGTTNGSHALDVVANWAQLTQKQRIRKAYRAWRKNGGRTLYIWGQPTY